MMWTQQKKRNLLDDQDVCNITVSNERYDEAIEQALNDNEIEDGY